MIGSGGSDASTVSTTASIFACLGPKGIDSVLVEDSCLNEFSGSQLNGVEGGGGLAVLHGPVMLNVAVIVTPEAGNAALDEGGSAAFASALGCLLYGLAHGDGVGAIDGNADHAVARGPLRNPVNLNILPRWGSSPPSRCFRR